MVGVLGFLLQTAQLIVLVPVMLQGWGPSQYATWTACQAAYSLLLTLDAGYVTFVGNEMTKKFSVDRDFTRSMLGSSLRFAVVLGVGDMALVCGLALTNTAGVTLGIPATAADTPSLAGVLLLLLGSWILVGCSGSILSRLYAPAGLYARNMVWALARAALLGAVVAVCAYLNRGLLETAFWMSCGSLLYGAAFLADCPRALASLRPFFGRGTLREGASAFVRSVPITASNLLVQLQGNGLVLLVSSRYGVVSLAAFSTLRTLANAVIQAATPVFAPAVPELVRLHVTEQHQKLRSGVFALTVVTGFPIHVGVVILATFVEPLYLLWTRHKIPFDRGLFHLLAAATLWRIFGAPLVNHLIAMNRVRSVSLWALSQTTALFLTIVAMSSHLPLAGVGVAILVGEVVGSVVFPTVWAYQDLERSERAPFVRDQLLAACTPAIATLVLILTIESAGAFRVGVQAAGVLCCFALFARQYLLIPSEMRAQSLGALKQLLGRGSRNA